MWLFFALSGVAQLMTISVVETGSVVFFVT
jgi:hypothetical protein